MQLSFSQDLQPVAYPGQLADSGPHDIRTGLSMRELAKLFTITVANSTAYELTFEQGSVDATVGYTSDGSATKAEIVAGLLAATPSVALKDWALASIGGDLYAIAKPGVDSPRAITSTGAGTVTLAAASGAIPFGYALASSPSAQGGPLAVRLPNAASDVIVGVALSTHFVENPYPANTDSPRYPFGSAINVLRSGRVWVKPAETVVAQDPVYVVYSGDKGAFRKSPSGTAQVTTITPTAVNSADYSLSVNGAGFFFTADGSATATEIVTGFKDLINAAAMGITATGTATLILTADVAGVPFTTSLGANLAAAATTPNVSLSALLPGARFLDSGVSGSFCRIQLNLTA